MKMLFNSEPENQGGGGTLLGGQGDGGAPPVDPPPASAPDSLYGFIKEDGTLGDGYHAHLPEDLQGHEKHFSKYNGVNIAEVFRGNLNLSQKLGKNVDAVVLPHADSTPEELAEYRTKAGIPESFEGYSFQQPEDLPEGLEWNQDQANEFAKFAHELNLNPEQANQLMAYHTAREGEKVNSLKAEASQSYENYQNEQKTILQKTFGVDYGKQIQTAQRVALTAGYTPEQIDSMDMFNDANVITLLARTGAMAGEHRLVEGKTLSSDPAAQAKDISTNPSNPLYEQYHQGDPTVRDKVTNLYRASTGGQ